MKKVCRIRKIKKSFCNLATIDGRKQGANERKADFLVKNGNKRILRYLSTGEYPIREISKLTKLCIATVIKVKNIAIETKALYDNIQELGVCSKHVEKAVSEEVFCRLLECFRIITVPCTTTD